MSIEQRLFMQAQVDEWRHSGMSMEAYAQKLGVTRYKFEYWVRKFRLETSAEGSHQFIQLNPTERAVPVQDHKNTSNQTPQPQMVLTFPSGACLKVYI